ncbi:hypothetical protein L1887_42378 [Cichorium endivia]|nr:hypothetical protein L1887_42378 [Cichorium endivia]
MHHPKRKDINALPLLVLNFRQTRQAQGVVPNRSHRLRLCQGSKREKEKNRSWFGFQKAAEQIQCTSVDPRSELPNPPFSPLASVQKAASTLPFASAPVFRMLMHVHDGRSVTSPSSVPLICTPNRGGRGTAAVESPAAGCRLRVPPCRLLPLVFGGFYFFRSQTSRTAAQRLHILRAANPRRRRRAPLPQSLFPPPLSLMHPSVVHDHALGCRSRLASPRLDCASPCLAAPEPLRSFVPRLFLISVLHPPPPFSSP